MPRPELNIDRVTRSRHNVFASVRLDRRVDFRDDPDWVRATLASSDTRIVPLWRSRNLLAENEGTHRAVYLRPEEARTGSDGQAPSLLGSDGTHHYFALPLDDSQRDTILANHAGAEFMDLRRAFAGLDPREAGVLAYAKALLYWQYRNAFCGVCGSPTHLFSAGHRLVCSNAGCARQLFPRIDPAIIVLIAHGDACLLGRNASWPPRRFSTLAGFVEPGESLEDAVVREVREEAHVRLSTIRYVSSQPWPFPGSEMCGFRAEAVSRDCEVTEEMAELKWLTPAGLDAALAADELRLPPPVTIAFRLIADWYHEQCGGDLEEKAAGSGGWLARKRIE